MFNLILIQFLRFQLFLRRYSTGMYNKMFSLPNHYKTLNIDRRTDFESFGKKKCLLGTYKTILKSFDQKLPTVNNYLITRLKTVK